MFFRYLRFLALLLGIGLSAGAQAEETLRVLAWPGYADADMVRAFEERFGVRVEVTIVGADDALWEKVNAHAGANVDVFAVNTAELQRYIDQGLSIPLQMANIPNTGRQLPRFSAP